MAGAFAHLAAEAEAQAPMSNGDTPVTPGRVLLVDGDGLCYYCAGNDDTEAGEARRILLNKVLAAGRACGAEAIRILITGRGGLKGFRYAVARSKPYQGQRTDSHRPKNWAHLREYLEGWDVPGNITVETTFSLEADDLFARYAAIIEDCVMLTQDKDMRMIPGAHMDWLTNIVRQVPKDCWATTLGDKLYGRAWFWSQMLHGDTADNIPGLPFYTTGEVLKSGPDKGKVKQIRCGDKSTAVTEMLPEVTTDLGATLLLQGLYTTCYGDRWLVEMLEQGILLWLRVGEAGTVFDVVAEGHPLHFLTTHADYPLAKAEIIHRIEQAVRHAEAQNNGDSGDAGVSTDEPGDALCSLPTPLNSGEIGAGPLPFNGSCAGDSALGVQQPARESGEQPQAVRCAQPARIPAWHRGLLAKARH